MLLRRTGLGGERIFTDDEAVGTVLLDVLALVERNDGLAEAGSGVCFLFCTFSLSTGFEDALVGFFFFLDVSR